MGAKGQDLLEVVPEQTWFRSAGCLAHSQLLDLSLEEGKTNVSRLLCLPLVGFLCPQ